MIKYVGLCIWFSLPNGRFSSAMLVTIPACASSQQLQISSASISTVQTWLYHGIPAHLPIMVPVTLSFIKLPGGGKGPGTCCQKRGTKGNFEWKEKLPLEEEAIITRY